jgi:NAD(P)-dependent dehydrogenase (short-subunit alcohol dehydrogenase family)
VASSWLMARVFITGSSDGLGLMAAQLLVETGHVVVLHARNRQRAEDAKRKLPGAEAVVTGDLGSLAETRALAEQVNRLGRCDAVIHNAGVGLHERLVRTEEGVPQVFAINVLAPYVLTALVERPQRLVYLSSGMHRGADASLDDLDWRKRRWQGSAAYSESKLCDVLLAFGIARRWPSVFSNAVNPGWVATKMGGPGAPDSPDEGRRTQAWLAVSDDAEARVSGKYFRKQRPQAHDPAADDPARQHKLLELCRRFSGIALAGA